MPKDLAKMLNTLCAEQWKNIPQISGLSFAALQLEELFLLLGVVAC